MIVTQEERERERQRHRHREKQAPHREPNVGLDPKTPWACPELKADAQALSHRGTSVMHTLFGGAALDVSMRQLCTRAGALEAARKRVLCDALKITLIRKSKPCIPKWPVLAIWPWISNYLDQMGRCSGETLKPGTNSIAVFIKLLKGCFLEPVKSAERS